MQAGGWDGVYGFGATLKRGRGREWAVWGVLSAGCWVLREERELAVGSWQLAVGSWQFGEC